MTDSSQTEQKASLEWTCKTCGLTNNNNIQCTACLGTSSSEHRDKVITHAKEVLHKYDQSHILSHINDIKSNADLNRLILQIYSIDFEYMKSLYVRSMSEEKARKEADENKDKDDNKNDDIKPFPHCDAFNINTIGDVDKLCNTGFKAIVEGKCCVIILAGGQGSRLGFNKPKGCYDIGLISHKSIYQLQIEKILAVKIAACKAMGIDETERQKIRFPIYFMTSQATNDETQSYLNQNRYFKYDYIDVKLFQQETFPCMNESNGEFVMKSASEIAMSPNGNGGIYSSLVKSGVYSEMCKNGIEYIQIFGIDNVLARIADPLWFGHMIESKADSSNKTCIKKDPHEKIGIMCLKNGKPGVTEYTELTKDMIELKQDNDQDKDLEYCYGNLAMHMFDMSFLKRICENKGNKYLLPIHIARKKIAYYDSKQMKTIKPQQNNGIKLEFFVFDTYQYSTKCTVYNILREAEFAAVKNAKGNDSPLTARLAHSNYWKKEIIKNGGTFENDGGDDKKEDDDDDKLCEVSALFAYLPYGDKGEFKKRVNGKSFALPIHFSCD